MNKRLTKFSAKDLEDLLLLQPRIFSDYRDPRRGPFEMLYLYGETADNDVSHLLRAVELANKGAMKSVGITEGELGHGYAGFDATVLRLKALGWNSSIPIVKLGEGSVANTLTEARVLVTHALAVGGDIGIVAPAFHLMRAFMTTVTAIGNMPIRVYAILGAPLRWDEEVVHSQGVVRDTRFGLFGNQELPRMEKYRAPEFGSLLSAENVLLYLEWRDR